MISALQKLTVTIATMGWEYSLNYFDRLRWSKCRILSFLTIEPLKIENFPQDYFWKNHIFEDCFRAFCLSLKSFYPLQCILVLPVNDAVRLFALFVEFYFFSKTQKSICYYFDYL